MDSNNSKSNPIFLIRHPKYYIDGGDLHIVAGGMLFRVHSYFFTRESTMFHSVIYSTSSSTTREGLTEQDPVNLPDVTAQDFEAFLWVFYNPRYYVYDNLTVEEWKTILRLAQEWDFRQVKELAVRELNKLCLLDQLALYEENQVDPRHLVPLYAELCAKDTGPLTLADIPFEPKRRPALNRFFKAFALAVLLLFLVKMFFWGLDVAFSHESHRMTPSLPEKKKWFSVVPPHEKAMNLSDPRCKRLPESSDGSGCQSTDNEVSESRRVFPLEYPHLIKSRIRRRTIPIALIHLAVTDIQHLALLQLQRLFR